MSLYLCSHWCPWSLYAWVECCTLQSTIAQTPLWSRPWKRQGFRFVSLVHYALLLKFSGSSILWSVLLPTSNEPERLDFEWKFLLLWKNAKDLWCISLPATLNITAKLNLYHWRCSQTTRNVVMVVLQNHTWEPLFNVQWYILHQFFMVMLSLFSQSCFYIYITIPFNGRVMLFIKVKGKMKLCYSFICYYFS